MEKEKNKMMSVKESVKKEEQLKKIHQSNGFSRDTWNLLVHDTNIDVALAMFEKYLENLKDSEKLLETSKLPTDSETIYRVVHKLSSTSEILGYVDFGKQCRALQKAIKENLINNSTEDLLTLIKQKIKTLQHQTKI
ncbi:MAG: Hpt domain-containing protein [Pseudobdellovibrionaceae bacterium]